MKWQREDEFKEVLDKAVKKGSKAAITTAQGIAVQDMAQGYKHVCALVDRHLKKAKPAQRLNAFFLISAICRHSLKKYKLQDKYTRRWAASIAELTGLLQGVSGEQMAQVEKVLASWRKERVFSDAVTNACTAALGLHSLPNVVALTASQAKPSEAQTDFASLLDVATAAPDMQVASPANSLFSEPSAGSIDAAVLDAFPPKTVASANIEPLPRAEDAAILPASHASTGSSRPPDPPSNQAPYNPFEAESYDYDPFESNSPPGDTAHTLPPIPPAAATQPNSTSAKPTELVAAPTAQPPTGRKRRSFSQPDLPLPPPPAATPAATAPVSRKRKSRWEDAPTTTHPAPTDTAMVAVTGTAKTPQVNAATLPASDFAEAPQSTANGLPAAIQQAELQLSGSLPHALTVAQQAQPPLPPHQAPKATSAKQNVEAQLADMLKNVEQLSQRRRHADGRSQPPAVPPHPAQAPLLTAAPQPPPQAQPPLPPLPPPQAPPPQPQPIFQHAHLSYPFGAAPPPLQAGQLPTNLGRPPPGAAHTPEQAAWPHMSMPHMGHMQPHQHVHAGLQQHHVPAPMHHHPSMLQQQWWPQQQGVSQGMVPSQPPQPPQAPPPPQWGSPAQHSTHRGFQQAANGAARPAAPQASNGPVRATAPQAPKWAPDAHFQDFPHTDQDATPMPTDVDSMFKSRRSNAPSVASAAPPVPSASNDVPAAPPSPPPGPLVSPPAAPMATSLQGNSAVVPPDDVIQDTAQRPVQASTQGLDPGSIPEPARPSVANTAGAAAAGAHDGAAAAATQNDAAASAGAQGDAHEAVADADVAASSEVGAGGSTASRSNSPAPDVQPTGTKAVSEGTEASPSCAADDLAGAAFLDADAGVAQVDEEMALSE